MERRPTVFFASAEHRIALQPLDCFASLLPTNVATSLRVITGTDLHRTQVPARAEQTTALMPAVCTASPLIVLAQNVHHPCAILLMESKQIKYFVSAELAIAPNLMDSTAM
jgi:hypothetical protein